MGKRMQQERLIQAYLETGNIARAARIAGYKNRQAAHNFLTNNDIAKNKILEAMKTTRDHVAQRFYEMLTQTDYILGKLLDQEDYRAAVKLIEVKIKYHHLVPNGLALPKEGGGYENHNLSKLSLEELEQLKSILFKCKPISQAEA